MVPHFAFGQEEKVKYNMKCIVLQKSCIEGTWDLQGRLFLVNAEVLKREGSAESIAFEGYQTRNWNVCDVFRGGSTIISTTLMLELDALSDFCYVLLPIRHQLLSPKIKR